MSEVSGRKVWVFVWEREEREWLYYNDQLIEKWILVSLLDLYHVINKSLLYVIPWQKEFNLIYSVYISSILDFHVLLTDAKDKRRSGHVGAQQIGIILGFHPFPRDAKGKRRSGHVGALQIGIILGFHPLPRDTKDKRRRGHVGALNKEIIKLLLFEDTNMAAMISDETQQYL